MIADNLDGHNPYAFIFKFPVGFFTHRVRNVACTITHSLRVNHLYREKMVDNIVEVLVTKETLIFSKSDG